MEEYRDIKGYEGVYQVSNIGNVRRFYAGIKSFRMMKPINHSGGYSRLKLRNKGNDKDVYIHRLVAEAFIEKSGEVVNHLDGNKKNNHLSNLEVCSQRENVTHAFQKRKMHSSFAGVSKFENKWRSDFFVNGKRTKTFGFNCETAAYVNYLRLLKQNNIVNKYA